MPKEHEDLTEKSFVRGTNYRKSRLRRTPIKISLGGRERRSLVPCRNKNVRQKGRLMGLRHKLHIGRVTTREPENVEEWLERFAEIIMKEKKTIKRESHKIVARKDFNV